MTSRYPGSLAVPSHGPSAWTALSTAHFLCSRMGIPHEPRCPLLTAYVISWAFRMNRAVHCSLPVSSHGPSAWTALSTAHFLCRLMGIPHEPRYALLTACVVAWWSIDENWGKVFSHYFIYSESAMHSELLETACPFGWETWSCHFTSKWNMPRHKWNSTMRKDGSTPCNVSVYHTLFGA
jgi:hypothetical protein